MPVCELCVNALKSLIFIHPIPVRPDDISRTFFKKLVTMERYLFKNGLVGSLGQTRHILFLVVLKELSHLSRNIGIQELHTKKALDNGNVFRVDYKTVQPKPLQK